MISIIIIIYLNIIVKVHVAIGNFLTTSPWSHMGLAIPSIVLMVLMKSHDLPYYIYSYAR